MCSCAATDGSRSLPAFFWFLSSVGYCLQLETDGGFSKTYPNGPWGTVSVLTSPAVAWRALWNGLDAAAIAGRRGFGQGCREVLTTSGRRENSLQLDTAGRFCKNPTCRLRGWSQSGSAGGGHFRERPQGAAWFRPLRSVIAAGRGATSSDRK